MISATERLIAGLVIVISSTVYIPGALADESPKSGSGTVETIPEAIDRAASHSSLLSQGGYFEDRSIAGDAAFTFGLGYDEARLAKEAQRLGIVSQDLLNQQGSEGPIIRTRDLPNPYTASLLTTKEESANTEQPTESTPADVQSTESEPVEPEPTNTEPTESEPVEPEPTETQPSEPAP